MIDCSNRARASTRAGVIGHRSLVLPALLISLATFAHNDPVAAKTKSQCSSTYLGCQQRCSRGTDDQWIQCTIRTCNRQYDNCVETADDAPGKPGSKGPKGPKGAGKPGGLFRAAPSGGVLQDKAGLPKQGPLPTGTAAPN